MVTEIVNSIPNNSGSWIGINDEIIDKLEDFQNRFMLRYFEAPKQGTPTGVLELDANMLLMKSKLTYVGKLMVNSAPNNMCSAGEPSEMGKLHAKGEAY